MAIIFILFVYKKLITFLFVLNYLYILSTITFENNYSNFLEYINAGQLVYYIPVLVLLFMIKNEFEF